MTVDHCLVGPVSAGLVLSYSSKSVSVFIRCEVWNETSSYGRLLQDRSSRKDCILVLEDVAEPLVEASSSMQVC